MTYYQINHIFMFSGVEVNGNSGAFSIMTDIHFQGPKTIPELLQERAISRQSIHRMIKGLINEGVLEYIDNPEHKRSKKITLTRYGKKYYLSKLKVLDKVMEPIAERLSDEEMTRALETMLVIRDGLNQFIDNMEKNK